MQNRDRVYSKYIVIVIGILAGLILNFNSAIASNGVVYTNEVTNYKVFLDDDADLLNMDEETQLIELMKQITDYTSVCLVTTDVNDVGSSTDYARMYYNNVIKNGNGTVFLIDMENRQLIIYSNGDVQHIITSQRADTIADNVYRYASDARYYRCCEEVFIEEYSLLSGKKIKQPMKYFSNAFLALIIALMINYFLVKLMSHTKKPSDEELLAGLYASQKYVHQSTAFQSQNKIYSPRDSGGGSSGGGGGSSGGGGGGSSGGHSF